MPPAAKGFVPRRLDVVPTGRNSMAIVADYTTDGKNKRAVVSLKVPFTQEDFGTALAQLGSILVLRDGEPAILKPIMSKRGSRGRG